MQAVFAIENFFQNLSITKEKSRTLAVPYNEVRLYHMVGSPLTGVLRNQKTNAQFLAAKAPGQLLSSLFSILP